MVNESNGVWDQIAGGWKQVRGELHKQWGKLTDDDLEQIKGNRDILLGKLQQHYGMAKDEASKQIDDWSRRLKS